MIDFTGNVETIDEEISEKFFSFEDYDLSLSNEVGQYALDPLGWVQFAFDWGHGTLTGFDGPQDWQIKILSDWGEQIRERDFDGHTSVKPIRFARASGHGIGKSALVSWIILFILSTRPMARGTVTANTAKQLSSRTWAELSKWKDLCICGHWFDINTSTSSLSIHHKVYKSWRADGVTCKEENSEAFAGQHEATSTSFYVFDEASAIPDKIWEVAEGGLTDGEPMFFAFGNPTRREGRFYKLFGSSNWDNARIDSRNVAITNKQTIQDWIDEYGFDSDWVRVRVRGEFPNYADGQFFPSNVVQLARRRRARYLGDDALLCGIDVSRGGTDWTYIVFRRGLDAKSERTYRIPGDKTRDSAVTISKIANILDKHKPDNIFVDATGMGGPFHDRLVQLGYPSIEVHFGGKPDDDKRYKNKTAEMADRFLKWMEAGGAIPNSSELEDQICGREFSYTDAGKLIIERKEDFKKRLGKSPDWGDALYLTFAQIVPRLRQERDDRIVGVRGTTQRVDYDPLAKV